MKSILARKAKEKGFKDEKEMLEILYENLGTVKAVGKYLGMHHQHIGARMRINKIKIMSNKKAAGMNLRREEYNKENGTEYKTNKEWLSALCEEYGDKEAAEIAGTRPSYARQCKFAQRIEDGAIGKWQDNRPSNLTGPWTDHKKSPCSECKWGLIRDKREPGCSLCTLRFEYDALVERHSDYPGVVAEQYPSVFWSARGHKMEIRG